MNFELVSSVFQNILCRKPAYELPKFDGKKVCYIVPLSGGIDSFCVGYTMLYLFPDAPINFVHADTGIEASGTEEALDKFEEITGRKIIRLRPKKSLMDIVETNGNYIPSQRARFCTQQTKTIPIANFYKALSQQQGNDTVFCQQFVGLRFDEPTRKGIDWTQDYIASAYPLQALGLTKQHVNYIVERIQGIPRYYLNKSRSGCEICIFSRRSEIISAWDRAHQLMVRAANAECLPDAIVRIYNHLPEAMSRITGLGRNWLTYYRPSRLNAPEMAYEESRSIVRKSKRELSLYESDLFGNTGNKSLFVAVEYHYHNGTFFMEPQVYFENMITYSTSLSGVKKALKHFWLHRLHTKEMHNCDEQELHENRQIQIIELDVNNFDQEIPPRPEGGFTWQNDKQPLYAIRKVKAVIERILLTEGLQQAKRSKDKALSTRATEALNKLARLPAYGMILNSIEYIKPTLAELVDDIDITDAPVACMACSR